MVLQPICEPVRLPLGRSALVTHVALPAGSPAPAHWLHFHDVSEIVLFDEAVGHFLCEGQRFPIAPGSAVFVPTMGSHDFQFDTGAKRWTLIQFDPALVEQLVRLGEGMALSRPLCVQPDAATAQRLTILAAWLADIVRADATDPLIERIVGLILTALCRLPSVRGDGNDNDKPDMARLLPAVERLRAVPGTRLTLTEAAALCHISPAYFSRRFSATFGCGFADYATSHRLHVAARRIATTAAPLSEIAYSLGFSSPSHFTAQFRRRFGIAPRQYRNWARTPHAVPAALFSATFGGGNSPAVD